jgi:hypothetical protein
MPRRNDVLRNSLPGLALAVASVLPAALSPSAPAGPPTAAAKPPAVKAAKAPAAKEFSIPISNLSDWAQTVVVTVNGARIEGHSKVHPLDSDCELHFGAHSTNFQGDPDGLVLEPMNVCVAPFPGKTEQSNADWITFSNQITGTVVTVSGVPRIWPEHLSGGNEPSNPNHAVEIHPLTSVAAGGKNFDFAPNIFAGDYTGGVGEPTALKIAQNTTVSVTRVGDSAEISFQAGTIGNFTVLDIVIDRNSIVSDGAGSFRMDGVVAVDEETSAPVHLVTAKGSPINDEIEKLKSGRRKNISMQALVLFSLSPKALLDAANESQGTPVAVEEPIQLILYGTPNN